MSDDPSAVAGGALNPKGARTHTKMTSVKNKSAANVQITAEQLLREAQVREPVPRPYITTPAFL
jgi:hypothetical protein